VNFLSLEVGVPRQKERLERLEEGEGIPTREKTEKWKERESMCGGVSEEREKKEKKIKEGPMEERHVEDTEENWKILADVAVQMLGHCRWWRMFLDMHAMSCMYTLLYLLCLMILPCVQIPFF